jgi:hypothetical protein
MRSKKRGIAWPTLVYGIIGVMVVLSIAAIFTGPLVKRNPALANFLGFELPKYYDPDQGITFNEFKVAERVTVANSMKALACSINSVASGGLDKSVCDDEYHLSESYVRQLEIEKGKEQDIVTKIATEIIECMKGYQHTSNNVRLLPCFQFAPEGGDDIRISNLGYKIRKRIEKFRVDEKDETAAQISRWGIIKDRFNWDTHDNKISSDTYTCIKGDYQVYVTNRPEIVCGLTVKNEDCEGSNLAMYGNSCVKCDDKHRLTVNLDQNEDVALKQITDATIGCWGKFVHDSNSDNAHCALLNIDPDFSGRISERKFLRALNDHGVLGKDLVGEGVLNLQNIEWNLNEIRKTEDQIFLCAKDSGINRVVLTKNPQVDCPVDESKSIAHGFTCDVKAFELPQEVTDWENYIIGLGDPKYLVYYEKFPAGEEAAWQFDDKTWVAVTLGVRSAFALFPVGYKAWKNGAKIRKAAKIADGLDSLSGKAHKEALEQITKLVGNSDKSIEAFLKATTNSNQFLGETLTKTIADDVAAKIVAGETSEVIVKSFQSNLQKMGAGKVASSQTLALQEILTSSADEISKINKLNKVLYGDVQEGLTRLVVSGSDDVLKHAAQGISKAGFDNFIKASWSVGAKSVTKDSLKKVLISFSSLQKTNPSLVQNMVSGAGMLTKSTGKTALEVADLAAKGGKCLLYGSIAAGATVITVESFGLSSVGTIPVAVYTGAKALPACGSAVAKAYLPILLGTGFLMSQADSKQRKYVPIGINKMGVVQPKPYLTDPATFNINEANDYYIAMTKEKGQKAARLFFASPCKTDIKVTKNYCSCRMRSRDFYYKFTDEKGIERRQPIQMPIEREYNLDYAFPNWGEIDEKSKVLFLQGYGGSTPDTVEKEKRAIETGSKYPKYSFFYKDTGLSLIDILLSSNANLYSEFLEKTVPTKEVFSSLVESYVDGQLWGADQSEREPKSSNRDVFITKLQFNTFTKELNKLSNAEYNQFLKSLTEFILEEQERRRQLIENCQAGESALYVCMKPETRKPFIFSTSSASSGKIITLPETTVLIFMEGFRSKFTPQTGKASDIFNSQGPYFTTAPIILQVLNINNFKTRKNDICHVNGQKYNPGFFFTEGKEVRCPWTQLDNRKVFSNDLYQELKSKNNDVTPGLVVQTQSKIFYNSDFFENLMISYSFKTFNYTGNKENIVKVCDEIKVDIVPPNLADFSDGYRYETVPCISSEPYNLDHYKDDEKWNDKVNYCYSGKNEALEMTAEAVSWGSIVIGLAAIPFTGGASGTLVAVVVAGADLTSVAVDAVLSYCGTWPDHAASLSGCFS